MRRHAQVIGLTGIIAVDAGMYHACAVRSDGHVFCWGDHALGDGVTISSDAPVEVLGISNAIAIDLGSPSHSCALLATGTVTCWGDFVEHQYSPLTWTPVTVPGITNAVSVSTGAHATCAALADGTVRCWGSNHDGLLGTGSEIPSESATPVAVTGISTAEEVRVGVGGQACALLVDGTTRCWGNNAYGQLGNGMSGAAADSASPVVVSGLDDVVAISAGWITCALRSNGTARCWGRGLFGELGNGTNIDSNVPVAVSGLTSANDAPHIAAGPHHTCALLGNGMVKCWGNNSSGQLGNGNQVDTSTPGFVPWVIGVRDLAAGGAHSCALYDTGSVRCWGHNGAGQLGDAGASGSLSLTPVTVVGLTDAVQIAAAQQSTCAIRSGGTVQCWGSNVYGQLGNGTNVDSDVPVTVSGLTNVVAIDMNNIHVCALLAAGTVRCGAGATISTVSSATAPMARSPARTCRSRSRSRLGSFRSHSRTQSRSAWATVRAAR